MPIDYSKAKIYKITSEHTPKIYIGSSCEPYLSNRLAGHKKGFKLFLNGTPTTKISSFELLKLGEVEITLMETYPCKNKDELLMRERYHIEQNKDIVVNKTTRTKLTSEERKSK